MKTDMNAVTFLQKNAIDFRCRVELLDDDLNFVEEISGDIYSVAANIDATSDIRRTANLEIHMPDEFSVEEFMTNWIDRAVRLKIGICESNLYLHNYEKYNYHIIGVYLLSEGALTYDATTRKMTVSLVDLMAYGTSARGSQIGLGVFIGYGSNATDALGAFVARYMKLKFLDIDEFPDVIPYDQTFDRGTYPIDVMKKIVSLYPTYEQFYGTDGYYHVHEIPTRIEDECLLDETVLDDLIISEKPSGSLSSIKNTTEIWGRVLPADYVATDCTLDGSTYTLSFLAEMETIAANATYCIVPEADSPANPSIRIPLTNNETEADTLVLYDSYGNDLGAGAMKASLPYVIKCIMMEVDGTPTKKFYLQGEKTIHVIVREVNKMPSDAEIAEDKALNDCNDIFYVVNPDSPYACDRNGKTIREGEVRQVLQGGDYTAIYTTDLAYERGKYENYLKTRMNTDVELKTVLIPFIDVNEKIQYTSPNTGKINQYLVKSVSMDVTGFTMTMKLSRFYNYYPF